ncbi:MAG: CoA pyrophosphatase [Burkholderiaceae bacterium]
MLFDPTTADIDAVANEPALPASRLAPDWLRQRFAQPATWTPEFVVEPELNAERREPVPAAVLVPMVVRHDTLNLLLTLRTAHLNDHAGQISFPGGRVDDDDADAIATALRETEEEIGLSRRHVEVIGCLPDYQTGTGFRVTPVAALVHPPFELQADSFEVAEIFEVPMAFLMDGTNHQRRSAIFPNRSSRRSFYTMPFEQYFIWGATAAMLRNLYHFLRAD